MAFSSTPSVTQHSIVEFERVFNFFTALAAVFHTKWALANFWIRYTNWRRPIFYTVDDTAVGHACLCSAPA
jgi:hypothetical protein